METEGDESETHLPDPRHRSPQAAGDSQEAVEEGSTGADEVSPSDQEMEAELESADLVRDLLKRVASPERDLSVSDDGLEDGCQRNGWEPGDHCPVCDSEFIAGVTVADLRLPEAMFDQLSDRTSLGYWCEDCDSILYQHPLLAKFARVLNRGNS